MKRLLKFIEKHYISIIIISILCIASSSTICENDLFFDIKTGEDILKNGITFEDHFSWIPNLKYLYLHWLYDVFIYCVHSFGGFSGLFSFFTLSTIVFFSAFYFVIYKISSNKIVALFATILTFHICNYAFVSRVQTIIYLLLFFEIVFLEKLYTLGEKKYSIYLIVLSILVVNLQMPIWIFYFILCLPYIFELTISLLRDKLKLFGNVKVFLPKNKNNFIISMVLIFLSGFFSPLTYNTYIYFTKALGNNIYKIIGISEMTSTIIIDVKSILCILFTMILGIYSNKIKISLRELGLFLGVFLFALLVKKNIIFFLYIGVYLLVKNIDYSKINIMTNKILSKINLKLINTFLFVLLFPSTIFVIMFKISLFENYGIKTYQDELADYIISNIDYKNERIYTEFNNGSYYIYRDIPVFIDSRAEVYIKEFNGGNDIIIDDHLLDEAESYKNILEKYKFKYLSVSFGNNLFISLKKTDNYCIIYSDSEYFLFEYVDLNEEQFFNK